MSIGSQSPALQTSERNCFAARMIHIKRGVATDEVELQLAGGQYLVCVLASERALTLQLCVGEPAVALVSPASITLIPYRFDAFKFSARNQWTGSIKQLQIGVENTEVLVGLQGGDALVAQISSASASGLDLNVGTAVRAIFKASSVILGVPG